MPLQHSITNGGDMGIGEKIRSFGMGIGGLAIVAALITIPVVLLFGAAWVSQKIFPWLMPAFLWTFAVCVFVLGPTPLFRSTRGFSAVSLMLASYAFGFVLWVWSFLLVLDLWGMIAVVIGLLLAGIGIVPVAILAALFHADWASLGDLAIMMVTTFGVRILSAWLASKADRERDGYIG